MTERLPYENNRNGEEQFLRNLNDIMARLSSWNIRYAVVGGMALRAILEKPVEHVRSNGTMVDFDAVALGPEQETIQRAWSDIKGWTKKKPFCPEFGLEPVQFGERPSKRSKNQFLSGVRKDDQGNFYLTYRDIEQPIPRETMEIVPRQYGGVTIPTFPAKTTLFRYLVRGGVLKPKDDRKLVELDNWGIRQEGGLSDGLYAPYLVFAERVRERYPLSTDLYGLYWTLDQLLGGRISGSGGYIYGLIERFR